MRRSQGSPKGVRVWWTKKVRARIAVCCTVAIPFSIVAVAAGHDGGSESPFGGDIAWIPTHDRVLAHEALPCTGPKDPTNFEIFSAGPAVAGLPLSAILRRCDAAAPAYEAPANQFTYVYGHCESPPTGESGCAPPLEVQTWPACQRYPAGYSFDGKALPSRELPKRGGAEVVEFDFALESRIEVYTKFSTIVIFADSPELARKAVELLTPQQAGKRPVTNAADLRGPPPERLGPPTEGAMEGDLECRS
jgi:hypothetical protein